MPRLRLCSAIVLATMMLGACASGEDPPGSASASSAAPDKGDASSGSTDGSASPTESTSTDDAPARPTVRVRIVGERVTPNAERVDLSTGEDLVFEVVSDRPGELHVHSKPEQYVQFDAGRTRAVISMKTPGSVQVEEHDTSAVVAIVEVR